MGRSLWPFDLTPVMLIAFFICNCSGSFQAMAFVDVLDVSPVIEESGDNTDSETEEFDFFLIFLARMVSMFLVKTVIGIAGSARILAE